MELRVHGIGVHRPDEVLGVQALERSDSSPILEQGDTNIGVYRLPKAQRPDVRALVWSRTTRRWLGLYNTFFYLSASSILLASCITRALGAGAAARWATGLWCSSSE
jgi:hypothetical protein